MAGYAAFQANLKPWIEGVWKTKIHIMQGVREKGRKEGAWRVYDLYNDPATQTASHFQLFKECIVEFKDEYKLTVAPQKGKWVENDFYHMEPAGYDPQKDKSRIYVNVKGQSKGDDTFMSQWANALCVAYKALDLSATLTGFQKLKVSGPGLSPKRHDNVVIWLTGQQAVEAYLLKMRDENFTRHFGATTPPGTKQVMPGLAWANEPPETAKGHKLSTLWEEVQHSFGSYLAGCIFLGLEQSHEKTEPVFLDAVLAMFKMAGVDPMNAQSVGISRAEQQQREFLTNMKATGKSLTTGGDSTSPMVVPTKLDELKNKTGE